MKSEAERCLDKVDLELSEGRITAEEAEAFRDEIEARIEQKRRAQEDFEAGKIDGSTLSQQQIAVSDALATIAEDIDMVAIRKRRKADHKGKVKRRTAIIAVFVAILVFAAAIGVPMWMHAHRTIAGIPEPVQIDIQKAIEEGRVTDIEKTIEGEHYRVDMTYLAEYDIKGLVVELDDFDTSGSSAFDLAVPRDISMAWGKAAEFATDIKWSHGARSLRYEYDTKVLDKAGVKASELNAMASNNHVIVEEGSLRKALKKVKIGDYIEMKGYLVSASFYDGVGQLEQSVISSTTRYDHVEYTFDMRTSCEVLYLTELKWLD